MARRANIFRANSTGSNLGFSELEDDDAEAVQPSSSSLPIFKLRQKYTSKTTFELFSRSCPEINFSDKEDDSESETEPEKLDQDICTRIMEGLVQDTHVPARKACGDSLGGTERLRKKLDLENFLSMKYETGCYGDIGTSTTKANPCVMDEKRQYAQMPSTLNLRLRAARQLEPTMESKMSEKIVQQQPVPMNKVGCASPGSTEGQLQSSNLENFISMSISSINSCKSSGNSSSFHSVSTRSIEIESVADSNASDCSKFPSLRKPRDYKGPRHSWRQSQDTSKHPFIDDVSEIEDLLDPHQKPHSWHCRGTSEESKRGYVVSPRHSLRSRRSFQIPTLTQTKPDGNNSQKSMIENRRLRDTPQSKPVRGRRSLHRKIASPHSCDGTTNESSRCAFRDENNKFVQRRSVARRRRASPIRCQSSQQVPVSINEMQAKYSGKTSNISSLEKSTMARSPSRSLPAFSKTKKRQFAPPCA